MIEIVIHPTHVIVKDAPPDFRRMGEISIHFSTLLEIHEAPCHKAVFCASAFHTSIAQVATGANAISDALEQNGLVQGKDFRFRMHDEYAEWNAKLEYASDAEWLETHGLGDVAKPEGGE